VAVFAPMRVGGPAPGTRGTHMSESRSAAPRRWLLPLVLAAVVAAAGGLGYHAGEIFGPPASGARPVLATVNGHPILATYVDERMGDAPPADRIAMFERRERFVESIITEELLLQSMLATDFADEPELREGVKALVAEHLIRTRIGAHLHVDEAEAERYYREHQSVIRGETVRVLHILMRERTECERLMTTIRDEAGFVVAAREHSIDPASAARGAVLGRVMDHAGALGFEQEMFRLAEGEMAVYDGQAGCHLVRAAERQVPPLPPYERVRDRIHALLRRQQEMDLLRALVQDLEARFEVERF